MPIPTEPIGSVPRPQALVDALLDPTTPAERLDELSDEAIQDTIKRFEATGSPIITDGEQRKVMNFASYSVNGSPNITFDGVALPFADGHVRQLPRLLQGPFHYRTYASSYVDRARQLTRLPLKQAVISASALSLIYPAEEFPDYSREAFIADLVDEAEKDIRRCFTSGAAIVQIDFTEGRLAVKFDPSKELLRTFIDLNNQVLERFTPAERAHIGVHTCPGGDRVTTHSKEIDYADLLPDLFQLKAGNFYMQLASEPDHAHVLEIVKAHARPDQRIFVGVIDPLNLHIETPEEVCERVLEAATYIPVDRLGTTDDRGFSPFADDTTRTRDFAFAKICARVEGTELAAKKLGV